MALKKQFFQLFANGCYDSGPAIASARIAASIPATSSATARVVATPYDMARLAYNNPPWVTDMLAGCREQPTAGCPDRARGASCNPRRVARQIEGEGMTAKGRDNRPTLTLKGAGFTPEFRSLLNKAAKKTGKTQAEFAAEVLAAAARRALSDSNPQDNPPDNPPPATVQQLEDMRAAVQAADLKAEETRKTVQDLAQKVQQLAEASARRGLWQRISGR